MAEGPTAIRLLSACPRPLPPTLCVASPDASSVVLVAGVHGVCTPYGVAESPYIEAQPTCTLGYVAYKHVLLCLLLTITSSPYCSRGSLGVPQFFFTSLFCLIREH